MFNDFISCSFCVLVCAIKNKPIQFVCTEPSYPFVILCCMCGFVFVRVSFKLNQLTCVLMVNESRVAKIQKYATNAIEWFVMPAQIYRQASLVRLCCETVRFYRLNRTMAAVFCVHRHHSCWWYVSPYCRVIPCVDNRQLQWLMWPWRVLSQTELR